MNIDVKTQPAFIETERWIVEHYAGNDDVLHQAAKSLLSKLEQAIAPPALPTDMGNVSDGYHTFNELYEHRITLWIALAAHHERIAWRSLLHSDGSKIEGWFVLGLFKAKGKQITYHLPQSRWMQTDFAETLDRAPEYDGHTPLDALYRIRLYA